MFVWRGRPYRTNSYSARPVNSVVSADAGRQGLGGNRRRPDMYQGSSSALRLSVRMKPGRPLSQVHAAVCLWENAPTPRFIVPETL